MAKVCIVNRESDADYKLCFVSSDSREKHTILIAPAVLVDRQSDADIKVFVVDSESNADILITRAHLRTR